MGSAQGATGRGNGTGQSHECHAFAQVNGITQFLARVLTCAEYLMFEEIVMPDVEAQKVFLGRQPILDRHQ